MLRIHSGIAYLTYLSRSSLPTISPYYSTFILAAAFVWILYTPSEICSIFVLVIILVSTYILLTLLATFLATLVLNIFILIFFILARFIFTSV